MESRRELPIPAVVAFWMLGWLFFALIRLWARAHLGEALLTAGGALWAALLLCLAFLVVSPPRLSRGGGMALMWMLFAAAAIGLGEYLLWIRGADKERFLFPGVGLLLSGAAVLLWRGRGGELAPHLPLRAEAALAACLLGLGLIVRLWKLGAVPENWWYDEVNLSRAIVDRVLQPGAAPLYVAENVENPGAYLWVGAALFKFWGVGVEKLRWLSAFYGWLALWPFYFLARRLLGAFWALVALALFAAMRWTLIPQRIAFMSGFALFWTLSAFYFYWRCLTSHRILDFAAFGLSLGATLHAYTPARLVAPLLLAFSLLQWRRLRGIPLACWVSFALAWILTAGPMLAYAATHWNTYSFRSRQVSILHDIHAKGWSELWVSLKAHLLMFHFRGDHQSRHNLHFWPQLDFVTACLFAPALLGAHGKAFRDPRSLFLILWFWMMLSAGVFSMTVEAPHAHRSILVAPAVPLMVALFLPRAADALRTAFAGAVPAPLRAAGLCLLLAVPIFNFFELSCRWAPHPATWRSFSPEASLAAKRALRAPQGYAIFASNLDREYPFNGYERNTFLGFFLRQQNRGFHRLTLSNALPEGARGVLAIWGESDHDITIAYRSQFPDRPPEAPLDPHEPKFSYLAAEIPAERIPKLKDVGLQRPFVYAP